MIHHEPDSVFFIPLKAGAVPVLLPLKVVHCCHSKHYGYRATGPRCP